MTRMVLAPRALVVTAIAAALLTACQSQTAQKKSPAARKVEASPAVAPLASPVKGPETAPVTIVEVSDFQ